MKDFKWVIHSNQIKYCPMTIQGIDVALKIWGKNITTLKGKTTRSKMNPVARDYVKVPNEFLKLDKEVFMTTDIFFVKINHLADRTVPQIFKAFKEIYQYYLQCGVHITTVHDGGEFAPLKTLIASIPVGPMVHLASANEHVPDIECWIQVVKEQCRATRHSISFQRIPKLMTIHIVLNVVKLLIFCPTKGGLSGTLSPKTIMYDENLDYKKHMSLLIGQYYQVHEEDNPCNIQISGTKGVIFLRPSRNPQGGFKFMALNTGHNFVRRNWDVIPMPDLVIS
jgi:hypothetical protein